MRTCSTILFFYLCLVITGASQEQTAGQDLKLTVRHGEGLYPIEITEYYSGENSRLEMQISSGTITGQHLAIIKGHHRAIIQRPSGNKIQVYDLDLDAREYIGSKTDLPGTVTSSRPSKVKFSGRTQVINRESVDTGERREMFGFQARHIITIQKTACDPGNTSAGNREVEVDGWYVDSDISRFPTWVHQAGAGLVPTAVAITPVGRSSGERDKIEVRQTGPAPRFPLKLKITVVYNVPQPDGSSRRYTRVQETEVVELSRTPLDATLFEVPDDFKKVDTIVDPTGVQTPSSWQHFKDRMRSIFR